MDTNLEVMNNMGELGVEGVDSEKLTVRDIQQMFSESTHRLTLKTKHALDSKYHKSRRSTSNVWNQFKIVLLDKVQINFVKCDNCPTVYYWKPSYGTGTLFQHLKSCNSSNPKISTSHNLGRKRSQKQLKLHPANSAPVKLEEIDIDEIDENDDEAEQINELELDTGIWQDDENAEDETMDTHTENTTEKLAMKKLRMSTQGRKNDAPIVENPSQSSASAGRSNAESLSNMIVSTFALVHPTLHDSMTRDIKKVISKYLALDLPSSVAK